MADGLKMLVKEDFDPRSVDRAVFYLAPIAAMVPAMIGWAVVPWGGVWDMPGFEFLFLTVLPGEAVVAVAPLNIGVIYILAAGSLGVYGIVLGGWASNNKYSLFGSLRATAQMLSYEIPMGLIVLVVLVMVGSAAAHDIVNAQAGYDLALIPQWLIVQQPIAAVLFFVCILAETNRAPFDLAECEQELVGGFHTEYSSMKFALFFLGEYFHMLVGASFVTILFLGGWHLPWLDYLIPPFGQAQTIEGGILAVALKAAVFFIKVVLLVWLMMIVRWTIPRFRFDQLMRTAWQMLIPISLVLLLVTGIMTFYGLERWMWLANVVLLFALPWAAQFIPAGPAINRRIALEGSRFSPAQPAS